MSDAPVNWCPGLGTVVANEEVTADGRSDRGNFPVFKRNMRQWMMRITAYADRLIDDLDVLEWTDSLKTMQRNWIGRSPGADVDFASPAGPIRVFTTRPDTLFGATFMVLAPEHPMVADLTTSEEAPAVLAYRRQAAARKDVDRQDENRLKTGVFTGSYATNPVTGQDIPIWIADYVLMGYGTGAIMAVPCGDQRDFEFATAFGLDIPPIQRPPDEWFAEHGIAPTLDTSRWPEAFVGDAPYVNSANGDLDLNGLDSVTAGIAATNAWLEANGDGEATITYKLRDWLFSRQRYWGEPFPIVYDDDGHPHALPDEQLPLTLPDTDSFSPRTFDPDDEHSEPESPLDRLDWWVDVELDLGDGPQPLPPRHQRHAAVGRVVLVRAALLRPDQRERASSTPRSSATGWARRPICDPTTPAASTSTSAASSTPCCTCCTPASGTRCCSTSATCRRTSRTPGCSTRATCWPPPTPTSAASTSRPTRCRPSDDGTFTYEGQPVTREWGKMGKSLKNAVSPEEIYEAYGSDTLRLHLMATGPLDASRPWETRDVVGMYRFLQRLWRNIVDEETGGVAVADAPADDRPDARPAPHDRRRAHRDRGAALQHGDRQADRAQQPPDEGRRAVPRDVAEALVLMVAPFAPHVGEELWHRLGHDETIAYVPFPDADPALLVDDTVEYPVQVNGKVRSHITVAADADATRSRPPPSPTRGSPRPSTGRPRRRSSSCPAGWSTSSSDALRRRHPTALLRATSAYQSALALGARSNVS